MNSTESRRMDGAPELFKKSLRKCECWKTLLTLWPNKNSVNSRKTCKNQSKLSLSTTKKQCTKGRSSWQEDGARQLHFLLIYLFILLNNILLALPYTDMNPPYVYICSPSWTSLPPSTPSHRSGSSQCTSPEAPGSCIKPGLEIHFTHNIQVSMPFSHIIPPLPSPRVQKTVQYICVSFSVLHIGLLLPSF